MLLKLHVFQRVARVLLFCCLLAAMSLFCITFSRCERNTEIYKIADCIEDAESFIQKSGNSVGFDTIQDICEPLSKRTVSRRQTKTFHTYDADILNYGKYYFINKISVEYVFKNFYFISFHHKNCLFVRAGPEVDIYLNS